MYKAEHEIFDQYHALQKTYDYIMGQAGSIREYWATSHPASITFTGCGSSYSICRSAERSAKIRLGISANAMATGDLLINFNQYKDIMRDTILIIPSRSGSTSEVIMAVKKAKMTFGNPSIAICAKTDSELGNLAGLALEIPWAFDESVCQTRTVTNLYTANLMLIGIIADDELLLNEIQDAIRAGNSYMEQYKDALIEVANKSWNKVVVLGDSELTGIAEEGALAFQEICRIPSNFNHVLDVRHGPMVLIGEDTLVIAAMSPEEEILQKDLIRDLKGKGAAVVTVSIQDENIWDSQCNITVPKYKNFAVMGIPFIFVPQAISFYKALHMGINPDKPEGLRPWIKL